MQISELLAFIYLSCPLSPFGILAQSNRSAELPQPAQHRKQPVRAELSQTADVSRERTLMKVEMVSVKNSKNQQQNQNNKPQQNIVFKQQSNVSRSKPGCVFQNYYISQDKSLSKCRENMFEVTSVGHLACTYYWAIICHPKSLSLLPPFFICITCTNSKTQNVLTEWTTLLVPVLKQTLLFGGVKPLNSMSW